MTTMTLPEADAAGRADVDAAQQEVREAEQLLTALEERVRAGDPGVKPRELRDAREVVDFARLRVEAAERRAEKQRTQARHALYEQLGADARALDLGDDAAITDAFTEALSALHRLWQVAGRRSTVLRDVAGRAASVVTLADQHGERDVLRAAGVHNGNGASMNGPASIAVIDEHGQGRWLTDVLPHHLVSAALARTFAHVGETRPVEPEPSLKTAARVFPALAAAAPGDDQDQDVTADE